MFILILNEYYLVFIVAIKFSSGLFQQVNLCNNISNLQFNIRILLGLFTVYRSVIFYFILSILICENHKNFFMVFDPYTHDRHDSICYFSKCL